MNRFRAGFSLLEVMLASLVLMIGVLAISRLSQGLLSGFDSSQGHGLAQHPAIVENILRDQVEQARSVTSHAGVATVSALVTPHGTYSVQVKPADLPIVPALNAGPGESPTTVNRIRYTAAVYYQAVGKAAPGELAAVVVFDKLTGMTGRSGL